MYRHRNTFISFAAGMLLGAAFLHLMPEAFALRRNDAYVWALAGLVAFYLLEHLVMLHSCVEEDCQAHTELIPIVFGLAIHSLTDGLVVGIGLRAGANLGIVLLLAVAVHKAPDVLATFSILMGLQHTPAQSAWGAFGILMFTPLGLLLGYLTGGMMSRPMLGALLSISCGILIYIAAADLIPQTHRVREMVQYANIVALVTGAAIMQAMTVFE